MTKLTDAVESMITAAENGIAHVGAANYREREREARKWIAEAADALRRTVSEYNSTAESHRADGAREALTRCAEEIRHRSKPLPASHDRASWRACEVEEFRDREYPAQAPEGVVLSDGSVFSYDLDPKYIGGGWWKRTTNDDPIGVRWGFQVENAWMRMIKPTDTGADFDAVKEFVSKVSTA